MKKRLRNIVTRHQVLLEKLKAGEVRKFVPVFDRITKATTQVLAALKNPKLGEMTKRELQRVLGDLQTTNAKLLGDATAQFSQQLEKLAAYEADFEGRLLREVAKDIKINIPTAKVAYAEALAQPISATGELLAPFLEDWSKGEVKRLNLAVQKAWGEGWTVQELTQAIRGTRANGFKDGIVAMSKRNAEAVARTSIQHVAESGRMATWGDNADIVTGYRWVATLDGATTQQCRSLDGQVFKIGEGPRPPIHINCRSTTVAELDPELGLNFLNEGATRSSKDGYVDAGETYYSWLKGQSKEFQDEALGATRAQLFRDGGLTADEFARLNLGRNFEPLTLEEMRAKDPLAFKEAGLDT